jgi:hypothetical protein
MAGEALCFRPALQAGWAHASGIEGVPVMFACARPNVLFARGPPTEWTSDAWSGRRGVFLAFYLSVENS